MFRKQNNTIVAIGIIFIILLIQQFSFAQNNYNSRPKLGLVLSGGGAKGIAHIGVLKAMEKEGLKPDFITGTSMGSIIGGLYALGYNADQLDSIIRSVNWDLVLSNNVPLNYIAYEEKEYYNRYLFEFPFVDGKLKLPSGMIEGQVLSELLQRFTWPANKYETFDDFPIPFRCIATDVSTGQPIVFDRGSLANAIRASMAIPTAFTAVDLDTTLAVDGGVVDNFPVDIARQMGADYIIGVNVGDGLKPADQLGGMSAILFQVSMIPSLTKTDEQIANCEVYIKPYLENYGTASFGNYAEILALGDSAGEQARPELRELAAKLKMNFDKFQNLSVAADSIVISDITIKGNVLVSDGVIRSKLQLKKGKKLSVFDVEDGIRSVYGTNNFSKVTYSLHKKPGSNEYRLAVKSYEKKPVTVKGAFHYDNTFSAGIVLNLTLRNLLGKSSRTMFITDISKNPKFRLDYLKYVGEAKKFGLNFRYDYLNQQIPSYNKGELQDVDISKENIFTAGLISTQSLRNSFYLGAGYQFNTQKSKFQNIVPPGVKNGSFNFGKIEFIYQGNTLNDRNYPTSGREITVLGQFFFANDYRIVYEKDVDTVYFPLDLNGTTIELPLTEDQFNSFIVEPFTPDPYGLMQVNYKEFINLNNRFQIIPFIDLGVTLSEQENAIFYNYRIGGYQRIRFSDRPFIGYNYGEVDFENFLITGIFFQNILFNNLYIKYGTNYLLSHSHVPLDNLDSFNFSDAIEKNSVLGYGAELTYKSFLGPISLGVNRNTIDPYFRYYFSIGFSFNYSD
jgi:NTE family protein